MTAIEDSINATDNYAHSVGGNIDSIQTDLANARADIDAIKGEKYIKYDDHKNDIDNVYNQISAERE